MPKMSVWKSVLVLMCLALFTGVFMLLYAKDASIAREHGPMENVQALWLLAGAGTFVAFAFRGFCSGRREAR